MIAASAQDILRRRAEQAEANRRAMPQVSAWLDEIRKTFPGATVKYAEEGGRVAGTRRTWHEVHAGQLVLQVTQTQPTKGRKK